MSVKLSPDTHKWLDHLRRWSGDAKSTLARRYIEEGVQMDLHPGIIFRDGPAGRRAALTVGPDVWQVVATAKLLAAETLPETRERTARWLSLSPAQVRTAIDYYAAFREEIEEQLAANAQATEQAIALAGRQREAL